MPETRWYDHLWAALIVSLVLPFFNIHFVWLSLLFMAAPIVVTLITRNKIYCNRFCGRGQLYQTLGGRLGISLKRPPPKFLRARWFRIGVVAVFAAQFGLMTYSAATGAADFAPELHWAMLMTTALGIATMLVFRPRSWCVYCPMGTVTQEMCRALEKKEPVTASAR